jgi:hypothetical protein
MSASEKAAETAKEVVADAAEEVSEAAEHFAEYTRRLNKAKIQFYLVGMAVGATTGALIAFKIAYRKAEEKYKQIADQEIDEMRTHYNAKTRAIEAEAAKRPVEDIVKERGYASHETDVKPPMAVQPPAEVVEEVQTEENDESETRNIFQEVPPVDHEWDYQEEKRRRSPDIPYVIHYDERNEMDYQAETLTYYEKDDVLCNERDEIIDPDFERDRLVGEANLERFGHGSNDPVIVYIRNDKLELVYEVVKSPHSFAEEVHGLKHYDPSQGNLERMRARERDDPEE